VPLRPGETSCSRPDLTNSSGGWRRTWPTVWAAGEDRVAAGGIIGVEGCLGTASAAMLMPRSKSSLRRHETLSDRIPFGFPCRFPAEALGREMHSLPCRVGNFYKRSRENDISTVRLMILDFFPDFSRMAGNEARGPTFWRPTKTPRVAGRGGLGRRFRNARRGIGFAARGCGCRGSGARRGCRGRSRRRRRLGRSGWRPRRRW